MDRSVVGRGGEQGDKSHLLGQGLLILTPSPPLLYNRLIDIPNPSSLEFVFLKLIMRCSSRTKRER